MVEKRKSSVRKWLVATGVLTGLKAKIIVAAVVTAVGVGGVVTYKQVTAPAEEPEMPVVREVEQPEPLVSTESAKEPASPEIVSIDREPPKVTVDAGDLESDEDIPGSSQPEAGSDEDIAAGAGTVRRSGGYGGRRTGSFWVAARKENEESDAEDSNSTDDSDALPRRRSRRSRRR